MTRKIVLAAILLVISATSLQALDLLDWRLGARPMSLGGAYTAVTGGIESLQWNPAGLSFMSTAGLMAGYTNSFGEVSHYYAAGAVPFLYGVLGGYAANVGLSNIPLASIGSDGRPVVNGYYSDTQWLLGLSYAQEVLLKGLALGGSVKGYYHKLYQSSTKGFGLDLGAVYDLSATDLLGGQTFPVSLGLTVVNVLQPKLSWGGGWTDTVSRRVVLGTAYKSKIAENDLTVSADYNVLGGSPKYWGVGAEYYLIPLLPIRLGYGNNYGQAQISAGIGLRYQEWGVDVAYLNHSDLGGNFQISLCWLPDLSLFSMREKPAAQTPPSAEETETPTETQAISETPAVASQSQGPISEAAAPTVSTIDDVLAKTSVISNGPVTKVFVNLNPEIPVTAVSFVTAGGAKIALVRVNPASDSYWKGFAKGLKKFDSGKVYIKLANGTVMFKQIASGK